jgi:hypothetical protein
MANRNKKPLPANKSALLKKGVGLTNQGQEGSVCPKCSQPIADGEMVNYSSGGMETHMQCPAPAAQQPQQPGQQAPGWQSRLNLPKNFKAPQQQQQQTHTPGMINPNVGKPTASVIGTVRTERKMAGKPARFSFAVPTKASGHVAFQLAKAGMKDFEVVHYEEDNVSIFAFPSEPDMHVAEEIVKAEFADQIRSQKGMWKSWSDVKDIEEIPETESRKPSQYVSSWDKAAWEARQEGKVAGQWGDRSYDSDQVHDVLDAHRIHGGENTNISFDDALPEGAMEGVLEALNDADDDAYLGTIVWMVSHGDAVPATYRERARQIAFALVQSEEYLSEWKNPASRKAELEEEIELLEVPIKRSADILPDAPPNPAIQAQEDRDVKRMLTYRRKKLLAWIEELGLDLSDELKRYDEGDFYVKDQVYESVRDMMSEERKFQSHYRRTMRGPRPYNRQQPVTGASTTDIMKKYDTPVTTKDIAKKYNTPESTTDIQKKYEGIKIK